MLDPLGVTAAAEAVYRSLLRLGPATAERAAEASGLPLAQAGGALAELAGLGLAHPDPDPPGDDASWRAASPEVALASLVVREQEALLERQRELDLAQRTVLDLVRIGRARSVTGNGGGVAEAVADPGAVERRCANLARSTERSLLVLDRLGPDGCPAADLGLVARGVDVQAIYERPALFTPGLFDVLRGRAAAGEQARTLPSLPLSLTVFDRCCAVVRLDAPDPRRDAGAVFVQESPLLTGLVALFELLWERSVPVPGEPAAEDDGTEPGGEYDSVLVSLLAAGFKDESIARHLGISPSTVTRRMARLMDAAGTSTRFQLGMQAARRGWI